MMTMTNVASFSGMLVTASSATMRITDAVSGYSKKFYREEPKRPHFFDALEDAARFVETGSRFRLHAALDMCNIAFSYNDTDRDENEALRSIQSDLEYALQNPHMTEKMCAGVELSLRRLVGCNA